MSCWCYKVNYYFVLIRKLDASTIAITRLLYNSYRQLGHPLGAEVIEYLYISCEDERMRRNYEEKHEWRGEELKGLQVD